MISFAALAERAEVLLVDGCLVGWFAGGCWVLWNFGFGGFQRVDIIYLLWLTSQVIGCVCVDLLFNVGFWGVLWVLGCIDHSLLC